MILDKARAELVRLGYSIVSESENEIIGVRSKWAWDAMATKMSNIVFLRAVGQLSAAQIAGEIDRMFQQAHDLDPSALPIGFQKGRNVIAFYSADRVEPDAQAFCSQKQQMRFASTYFPIAFDRSSGQTYYLPGTPLWGAIYYTKFRHLAGRLAGIAGTSEKEPASALGITITALLIAAVLFLLSTVVILMVFLALLFGITLAL